jgi:predicted phosphodiesterase
MIRIISDIHFGDRASGVMHLNMLLPLFDGAEHVIFNGDTLDTRLGPNPQKTAEESAEVNAFIKRLDIPVTCITGNHDPDFSLIHHLDLALGQVLVMHGDLVFDSIVPWARDAALLKHQIKKTIEGLGGIVSFEQKLIIYRALCLALPQGHQAEVNPFKYGVKFLKDTAWPPWRLLGMVEAWRTMPMKTAYVVQHARPKARFVITGHTHWPGVWKTQQGITVLNTGSFCRPLGCAVVELTETMLVLRNVRLKKGSYYPAEQICELSLAH